MSRIGKFSVAVAAFALAGVALSGCGKPEDASAYTGASPEADEVKTPPPPLPPWAGSYMGRDVKTVAKPVTTCNGAADLVSKRYTGAQQGMSVEGWGWDAADARPFDKVLLTNAVGTVIGAATVGNLRSDVPKASPQVKSQAVGWKGVVKGKPDEIRAFGLTSTGGVCQIGALET